jgi:hypothetical protein
MSRLALLAVLMLALPACPGDDGDDQPAHDAAPTQCDYFGTLYDDGEIFPAGDGCNSCKCNPYGDRPGEWACTLVECLDAGADAAPVQCDYFGTLYDDGEIFPAGDGCNSCQCNPYGDRPGEWACSLVACLDAGVDAAL